MELTPKVEFLGLTFDLTVMISSLLTALLVFCFAYFAARGSSRVPHRMQALLEMLLDLMRGITKMGFEDRRFADKSLVFTLTLFLYILFANQIGVMLMVSSSEPVPSLGLTENLMQEANAHGVSWLKSPTADINVPIAIAIAIALFGHILGMAYNTKAYFKGFLNPLHIIEDITRPMTHAIRLWANIFAGEIFINLLLSGGLSLGLFKGGIALGIPLIIWLGFSLFVGAVQAYVFVLLANVYTGQKLYSVH